MSKKRLILLLIIIFGIWYFWGSDWYADRATEKSAEQVEENINVEVKETSFTQVRPIDENVVGEGQGVSLANSGQASAHFFTKEDLASCTTKTVGAVYEVDDTYGHPAAGALVEMTMASYGKLPGDYVTSIPIGTRLLSLNIDKEGVATADYNDVLIKDMGECGAIQRRAQIEHTIQEFPNVKGVVITVNGEVWE